MDIFLYLLLGALFTLAASFILREVDGVVCPHNLVHNLLLLVVGLWLESKAPRSETAVGLAILLAYCLHSRCSSDL